MSFKKNQKKYNKDVMRTGYQANQYLRNALGLINNYTTNYADRNDFWTNKLDNRQLDLLSDKYLAENANMLRGSAAFGSNSATNRQIENNAYTQQNYLANVANQNVMNANQLQQNELSALSGASNLYGGVSERGAQAAQNVDAANNAWAGALGQGLSSVGKVVSFLPGVGTAVGAGMQLAGGALTNMASPTTNLQTQQYRDVQQGNFAQTMMRGTENSTGLIGGIQNLSTNIRNRNKGNFDVLPS
jgi:hypothetical protein